MIAPQPRHAVAFALRRAVVAGVLMTLAACASRPMPPPQPQPGLDVSRSLDQPFRDLSLIREVAPDVLVQAAAQPYDLTGLTNCPGLAAELARLDDALGPDLKPGAPSTAVSVQGLAADLVSGAVGLPFRGIVRRVSGAQAREDALRAAVLAGMVRRGFLKGRAGALGCPSPSPAI